MGFDAGHAKRLRVMIEAVDQTAEAVARRNGELAEDDLGRLADLRAALVQELEATTGHDT